MAVPLSPVGKAAAAMVPVRVRARRHVCSTRAGRLVRRHRRAHKKG